MPQLEIVAETNCSRMQMHQGQIAFAPAAFAGLYCIRVDDRDIISFLYFSVGASASNLSRQSVDSAAMPDFRPSDIQLNLLNNTTTTTSSSSVSVSTPTTSEVVMLPSNLAFSSSSLHHPHHRHHRPFPLQSSKTITTTAGTPASLVTSPTSVVASTTTPTPSSQTLFTDIP